MRGGIKIMEIIGLIIVVKAFVEKPSQNRVILFYTFVAGANPRIQTGYALSHQ